jgi:hypothetical protein
MRLKPLDPAAGTHIPVLKALVAVTEGRIIELGGGVWSTTFLHWACWPDRRLLTTYEHNEKWFHFLEGTNSDWHDVVFVEDWDALDLSAPCSIALVDSEADRRRVDVERLRHAEFVVAHDADYGYYDDVACFKFKVLYTGGAQGTRDPRQYFPASHVESQ